jgi:hypothetical protein
LCQKLLSRTGETVFSGPFAGMKLLPRSHLASRPIWIVGCYEKEVHEVINEIISLAPPKVIEIGSAQGYYLVGLAMHLPKSRIVGFEAEPRGNWEEAKQLALLNGVAGRVEQRGVCARQDLTAECEPGCFVLCDCEGAEAELLDPAAVEALKSSFILCELHDFYRPGLTGLLVDRFKHSHRIKIIEEVGRNPMDYRVLWNLSAAEQQVAVMESRNVEGRPTYGRFMWLCPLEAIVNSSSNE